MQIPKIHSRVWWWNLDREGNPIDPGGTPERDENSPPLKSGSPYTSTFYEEGGTLPAVHLHHRDGRIIGIHGEGDIHHLRTTLLFCLQMEKLIIKELSGKHNFDIMLEDVYNLLRRPM